MTANGPTPGMAAGGSVSATYCDRCGQPLAGGQHEACTAARELEPPRFCARCRRRMVVQVTPTGWTAHCSEHGAVTST